MRVLSRWTKVVHVSKTDELLTTAQVAELTGWSITSVNRWANSGDLPPEHKLPGRTGSYLFRRSIVEQRIRVRGETSGLIRGEAA